MDTLSETLRDYISIYKINGITGGALPGSLTTDINSGNFKAVYEYYFKNEAAKNVLALDLKDDKKDEFKDNQVELVTTMLKYLQDHPQTGSITAGEPTLGSIKSLLGGKMYGGDNHNKYWDILGIAAKLVGGAPGAAPVAGKVTPPGDVPVAGKVTPPGDVPVAGKVTPPEPEFITTVRQIIAGNFQEFSTAQIVNAHTILFTSLEPFLNRYIKSGAQRDDISGILNGANIADPALRAQRDDIAGVISGMNLK